MADIAQRSPEWLAQRAGKVTGSRFADVMAVSKRDGKPLAARTTLMRQLAFERRSGNPRHEIGSKSMAWGAEIETFSAEAFELETGLLVTPAEFVVHPVHPFVGASADGWTSDGGGLEMKAPHDEGVHILTLLEGMPEEHIPQVQGGMWVSGKPHWWFASYDPRQAEPDRLFVQKIARDDAYIAKLASAVLGFEDELQALIRRIENRLSEPMKVAA